MIPIFTLLALLGAVVASYTDIRFGVIRNKLTMPLFAIGFIGNLLVYRLEIVRDLFTSVLLIFVIGYAFWRFAGWSAGEIKEFLFLAALLPRYPSELKGFFSPLLGPYPFILTIFLNTFLVVFPFILLWGVYLSYKKGLIKEFLSPIKDMKKAVLSATVFTGAILLSALLNVSIVFAIPLIIFSYRVNKRLKVLLSAIIGAVFILESGNLGFLIEYFVGLVLTIMVFQLIWNSMNVIRSEALHENVLIRDLKEGMVISEDIYIEKGKVVGKGLKERVKSRGRKPVIEKQARGLTKEELEKIQELHRKGKLKSLRITKAAPFAPVVLAGLLISLYIGDIVMVVTRG